MLFVVAMFFYLLIGSQVAKAQCPNGTSEYLVDLNLPGECFDESPPERYNLNDDDPENDEQEMAHVLMFDSDMTWVKNFPYITVPQEDNIEGIIQSVCLVPGEGYHLVLIVSETCTAWTDFLIEISPMDPSVGPNIVVTPEYLPNPGDSETISLDINSAKSYKFEAPTFSQPPIPCAADLNGDHVVNTSDLLVVLSLMGQCN